MRLLLSFVALLASLAMLALPAEAARQKSPRTLQQPAPTKDCTRLNGRDGYYGNPWCSKAEQDAWDRATSRRVR